MCEYCHEEYCCVHGRQHRYYHPGYGYRPAPVYYYERPAPEIRRESLETEKKVLEQRLKEIEKALTEESKQ